MIGEIADRAPQLMAGVSGHVIITPSFRRNDDELLLAEGEVLVDAFLAIERRQKVREPDALDDRVNLLGVMFWGTPVFVRQIAIECFAENTLFRIVGATLRWIFGLKHRIAD